MTLSPVKKFIYPCQVSKPSPMLKSIDASTLVTSALEAITQAIIRIQSDTENLRAINRQLKTEVINKDKDFLVAILKMGISSKEDAALLETLRVFKKDPIPFESSSIKHNPSQEPSELIQEDSLSIGYITAALESMGEEIESLELENTQLKIESIQTEKKYASILKIFKSSREAERLSKERALLIGAHVYRTASATPGLSKDVSRALDAIADTMQKLLSDLSKAEIKSKQLEDQLQKNERKFKSYLEVVQAAHRIEVKALKTIYEKKASFV